MKPQPERAGELCPICENDWLCKHGLCKDVNCTGSYGEDEYQCQDCAEAQEQRFFEEYWGGESVFCESRTDRSAREKREKDGILP